MHRKKKLKVAAIMDAFTYACYAPECELLQITPDDFKAEIDGFSPDLLFIESVWRGKDNLWRFKLHDNMEALCALTAYCRANGIPVVFWSKEDPVHFGVFIRAAALADFVFTTDADCIELDVYKRQVYIISVPTPYDQKSKKVNMDYVAAAVKQVLAVCPQDSVIVIESTVSPGSIDRHIRPLVAGNAKGVRLAHAPERIIPGSML